jgi:hypothetical protein
MINELFATFSSVSLWYNGKYDLLSNFDSLDMLIIVWFSIPLHYIK